MSTHSPTKNLRNACFSTTLDTIFFFFNLNSMNEEWYFFSASIYIFLKNEDEHFSICLLAIFISSENSYSLSFFPLVVYLIESRK